jgi:hypothetical protein
VVIGLLGLLRYASSAREGCIALLGFHDFYTKSLTRTRDARGLGLRGLIRLFWLLRKKCVRGMWRVEEAPARKSSGGKSLELAVIRVY